MVQIMVQAKQARKLLDKDLLRGADALEKIIRRYPKTVTAQQASAKLKEIKADEKTAAKLIRLRQEKEAKSMWTLAQNYLRAGKPELARKTFNELIRKYPTTSKAAAARKALAEESP